MGFPNCLDPEILGEILAGGADKVKEAGAVLVGGHSYRMMNRNTDCAYQGLYIQIRFLKNYGSRPGDVLILTKQIGKWYCQHCNQGRDGI